MSANDNDTPLVELLPPGVGTTTPICGKVIQLHPKEIKPDWLTPMMLIAAVILASGFIGLVIGIATLLTRHCTCG